MVFPSPVAGEGGRGLCHQQESVGALGTWLHHQEHFIAVSYKSKSHSHSHALALVTVLHVLHGGYGRGIGGPLGSPISTPQL